MNLLPEIITDTKVVGALIPQKKPFVMVDSLLVFTQNSITAGLTVTKENIFSQSGSFTAPGVIEHMAQSVALHTGYDFFLKQQPAPTGYIGAIKKIELVALPNVGETLTTTVTIIQEFMGITLVAVSTKCNGKIIATGEMKTALA